MSALAYRAETPRRFIFHNLFLFSAAIFMLYPIGTNTVGFVLLAWSVALLLRIIWLMETILKSQRGTQRSRLLPWIILTGMQRRQRTIVSKKAHHIFNLPFLYWFICAGLFLFGSAISNIIVDLTPLQIHAAPLITDFFNTVRPEHNYFGAFERQTTFLSLGFKMIIASAFFLAHTYAYTNQDSIRLWAGPFVLFWFLLIASLIMNGTMPVSWPSNGKIFMYLAACIPAFSFVRYHQREGNKHLFASAGIACLVGMVLYDLFAQPSQIDHAFWLAGWICISIFWAQVAERRKDIQ